MNTSVCLTFQISVLKPLGKMFHTFLFCLFMWSLTGVFGDEVKSISVMEGDSVTLHTDITELDIDDHIIWRFGPQRTIIANMMVELNKHTGFIGNTRLVGRFKDRLQLNAQTGDLIITNITTQQSGLYQVMHINSKQMSSFRFNVTVCGVSDHRDEVKSVSDHRDEVKSVSDHRDEVKSVLVMEGDSLTLHTNTKLQTDDLILWRFGFQKTRLAKINKDDNKISIYDDVLDGRFRDRLQVNNQTGDLTITNITTQHTGLYQINVRGKQKISYRFNVAVCGKSSHRKIPSVKLTLPVLNQHYLVFI
ncbi:uncharacterized protein [Paramisgurnus dabryanus]|uniref:uncharacterized protein n=1 Tax=Paramisgurnus dabryanus TaxID=90735 RepID=UPI0031F3DCE4